MTTRRGRPEGAAPEEERTSVARRARTPPASSPGGRVESDAPGGLPLERMALVALVLGRERAAELFDGLRESDAARARAHLAGFQALSSARRQARVAVEFGGRPDAEARLRGVMREASEALRRELLRRLPPYHRSLFPEQALEPASPDTPERIRALAERLIREATR
jgi:hypothetical protein